MKNRPALKLFICLAAAALVAACAQQQGGQQGSAGKRLRLAFVTNNASDYWTIARKGTEKAVGELGNVDLEFRMPGEGSAAEQKRIVDDLLAKGIDGMAISPVDPANQTQMINDAARQILVITQDSDAPESQRACYIGTNNREAGKQAGQLVRETLPQGGKIMVFVGKADAQNARERFEGLKEALAGSNVQIIDLRTDDAERVRAKSNAADTLVKYPDVAAMVGLWAYNGPAILSAVRDAGKVGQVKIIAFDEEDDTLKGVQEGAIEGTVVQQPYEFGYQAIKMMAQVVGGDRSAIPASKQIFVPTKVIRKDTVEEFTRQLNQLRGRS
ncbi:MAG TPA: sugar-binding protein [Pyrinomonadaceae bacterium]|nr:sugar-binding protein [Pyrinomonadaceae bacterium]